MNDPSNSLDLTSLCRNFQSLFQKLKSIKKQQQEISEVNSRLIQEIEDEKSEIAHSIQFIYSEKNELTFNLKKQQEGLQSLEETEEHIDNQILLFHKEQTMAEEELKGFEIKLEEKDRNHKSQLQKQTIFEEEAALLRESVQQIISEDKKLQQESQQVFNNLQEQKEKLGVILKKLEETENNTEVVSNERQTIEFESKQIDDQLKLTIKRNKKVNDKILLAQKPLHKMQNELNSKTNRLNTQYQYNYQLRNQLDSLHFQLQYIIDSNNHADSNYNDSNNNINNNNSNNNINNMNEEKIALLVELNEKIKETQKVENQSEFLDSQVARLSQQLDLQFSYLNTEQLRSMYLTHYQKYEYQQQLQQNYEDQEKDEQSQDHHDHYYQSSDLEQYGE